MTAVDQLKFAERSAATPDASARFPMAEAQRLVEDLNEPHPLIYWADFLCCVVVGWAAFVAAMLLPDFSLLQFVALVISAFALYRGVLFIHELSHGRPGTFRTFRAVWDLTLGFLLQVPSFAYSPHIYHHSLREYGRAEDGEYVAFGAKSPIWIVLYTLQVVLLPLAFPLRFIVVTPISLLIPKLRKVAWEGMSSLVIDYTYRRPPASAAERRVVRFEEFGCWFYGTTIVILLVTGVLPLKVLVLWYLITVSVFLLNSLRTLAAHAYRNAENESMTWTEQFLDSIDVPGNPLWTPLWAPVGLRFHATHHLFPSIPYHSLGEAHRRLSTQFSARETYLSSTRSGMLTALKRLWCDAASSRRS